ncbi:dolichol kinase [Yamadazyma tenuis]|uniref:dolichol kinase n=1 Tax=Candida tenuis (strain ATCC 10573 / BCRC 21748 / CBS 615 / JCM 9827 / NBRC 10315 / NRRL Y-1498 / VKM Y-70) TaxID=590646 RepID=G3AW70_CANTC|nr:uncharacterized protein CANTEDRAFT_117362 [Yamadazyma tenuis ATCC 10573]XP_006683726.1 uncharacterized protein CANTEDRAFT_117362 [Yamadazyma tenuis ATCC 10573]EGV66467.1 hypothetical protein CANTEDRAFT_117362 [Yamadazyma tenuis ATCC 10573]EGV66468.1 hypothetical protein CANTEDRAFT_117362 [Yamadazyma tenuis ATCC 10573]WEJ95415.1 dolichol kinase [Yamadazyma tenuis]
MARKAVRKSASSKGPVSVAERFKESDGLADPRLSKVAETQASPTPKAEENPELSSINPFGDDPYTQPFPFNHIYATQDFLNEHLDYRKGVQILLVGFLLQSTYNFSYDLVWEYLERIAMNFSGVAIGLVFTHNLKMKKYLGGTGDKPTLPEFNLLFAVLIPVLFSLKFEFNLIENLTYNYFTVENLPIVVRGFSGLVYYFLYSESDDYAEYTKKLVTFTILNIALEYINQGSEEHVISKEVQKQDVDYDLVEVDDNKVISGLNRSLSRTEVQMILVILINLIFNLDTDDINLIIFQKLVVSLIVGLFLAYPVYLFNKTASIPVFAGVFYYLTNYQLEPILKSNSVLWVWEVVQQAPNFQFFSVWAVILLVNIFFVFNVNIEFNLRRKLWHFVILGTILPGLVVNRDFTVLALLGSLIIMVVLEVVRTNKITIIGEVLYNKLYQFQDFKDLKGPFNLSYIYLLAGITTPVILSGFHEQSSIKQYVGLIALGVGDSFASIVGKAVGTHKIFDSNKTVEGSAAFFVSIFATIYAVNYYLELPALDLEVVFVVTFLSSVFEGVTDLNDNLFVPIITYLVWNLLEK